MSILSLDFGKPSISRAPQKDELSRKCYSLVLTDNAGKKLNNGIQMQISSIM